LEAAIILKKRKSLKLIKLLFLNNYIKLFQKLTRIIIIYRIDKSNKIVVEYFVYINKIVKF
jgi:hypothetical protein